MHAVVLVDGGLSIPGSEGVDPQAFVDALLGPAMARLKLRFADRDSYRDWWRAHPALSSGDVADEDVRADACELLPAQGAAHSLTVSAKLLCAPRGLLHDPNPMQPLELAHAWAQQDPGRRQAALIPDVNHYTITLGTAGAAAVADAIAATATASRTPSDQD